MPVVVSGLLSWVQNSNSEPYTFLHLFRRHVGRDFCLDRETIEIPCSSMRLGIFLQLLGLSWQF